MATTFAHTQTLWAKTLAAALADAGVREVFASPGSRSTPLILAFAAESRLLLRVVIDERSAGFAALGRARATGVPTALLCTSGSALLHYGPALVEADHAGVPLVVVSADRPPRLRHCGASQTIDQPLAYGSYVRRVVDLSEPAADAARFAIMVDEVHDLVGLARRELAPVHLNVPLDKPLEPAAASTVEDLALAAAVAALPAVRARPGAAEVADQASLERAAVALLGARRCLILAGPLPRWRAPRPELVWALAKTLGAPVIAEPGSQLRFEAAGRGLRLDTVLPLWAEPGGRAALTCDLILQLGPAPTASESLAFLEEHRGERIVLSDHGPVDPFRTATQLLGGALGTQLEALLGELAARAPAAAPRDARYLAHATRLAAATRAVLEADLRGAETRPMEEGLATRALLSAVPPGWELFLGNSLPLREADLHGPPVIEDLTVHTQRGTAGIDGNVAGAAALALAGERPVLALLGDVTFAHDLGSLTLAQAARAPLILAVIDNGGGRIFEALPIAGAGAGADFDRLFTTSPAIDLAAAARSFSIDYVQVREVGALRPALEAAGARRRATLLHLVVTPSGARAARARRAAALRAAPFFAALMPSATADAAEGAP